jgi:hypothetical protein
VTDIASRWKDRVVITRAQCDRSETPVDALLIRPDAWTAWAAAPDESDEHIGETLRSALTTWFGAASGERRRLS